MKVLRTILRALLALIVATVGVVYAKFWLWRTDITRGLEAHSVVVQTARGPIEYAALGTGYPALFLHGTPGGYDQIYQATQLSIQQGQPQLLRVIAPSRPGYLRTPLSVGATPQEQADAFKALLDTLQVDKVVVFGLSGGGPSALRFVLQHPERCAALVLESAITQALEEKPTPTGLAGLAAGISQTELGRWLFSGFFIDSLQRINPADSKVRPLAAITCPTLIVHGAADRTVPFTHAQFAHEQIAGSQLEAFEGGDHFTSVTYSTKIDVLVNRFVAAHVLSANGGQ